MEGAEETDLQTDLKAPETDDQRDSLQGLIRQAWGIQNGS
jgi:hypothetical protein